MLCPNSVSLSSHGTTGREAVQQPPDAGAPRPPKAGAPQDAQPRPQPHQRPATQHACLDQVSVTMKCVYAAIHSYNANTAQLQLTQFNFHNIIAKLTLPVNRL